MGEDVNYPHPPLLINTFVTKDRLYSPTHDKDDSEDDGCLAMNVALYLFYIDSRIAAMLWLPPIRMTPSLRRWLHHRGIEFNGSINEGDYLQWGVTLVHVVSCFVAFSS